MPVNIYVGLYDYLTGVSAISNLISSRLYPDQAPEGAEFPYVVYARNLYQGHPAFGGDSDFAKDVVQLDVYGVSRLTVEAVVEQIRLALDTYQGDMEGVDVRRAALDNIVDNPVSPVDGSDVPIFLSSMTWTIHYRRTAA